MEQKDLLYFAISKGIIDFDTIQQEYEMNERKKYLESHIYDIWEGKNGKWYTYFPDEIKGRVLKKRITKKAIEDLVIEYYKAYSEEFQNEEKIQSLTLKDLFPKWIVYKQNHTNSSSYIKRITSDWAKFYEKELELINRPLKKLDKIFLDEWVHKIIKEKNLTKKSYYNMSVIIRQCLDYAVELKYIESNVFSEIKINTKLFKREKKKESKTEVYTEFEEENLIMDMFRRFERHPSSTAPLAVVLAFELGLRIGEMCALKFSDICGNYIYIQRQEIREFEFVDDYSMRFKEFKIVDYAKTEDGNREVFLTQNARKLIELVKEINIANGESNDSYIFIKDGNNINHYSIQAMIKRGCEHVNILVKTSHKIRKTYVSKLIDSGLNIDAIRRMVGHSDEKTTLNCYCFNRLTDIQTENVIEDALKKKVIKGNQDLIACVKRKKPKTVEITTILD